MREQIRVRVEHEEWEALRQEGESNTELLARLLQEWQAQKVVLSALKEIDASPAQALGRLLLSYELLQQASVSIQPSKQPLEQPSITDSSAAVSVPSVPTIGGLENNSTDW